MVIFGLTVIIAESTGSTTAVSALILTFLAAGGAVLGARRRVRRPARPAARPDRARTSCAALAFVAIYFVGDHLGLIYLLNITVSTITVFFGPAEAAMIPKLVPKRAAAVGERDLHAHAERGVRRRVHPPRAAHREDRRRAGADRRRRRRCTSWRRSSAGPCRRLRRAPSEAGPQATRGRVREAESAMGEVVVQLREGIGFIRGHREVRWSLAYLAIAASLVGVLGVLGPAFAAKTLGPEPEDFVVIVLPLGVGIVVGILLLNAYGRLIPRRRVIEGGLIALGILLALMALSGRISAFLDRQISNTNLPDLSLLTSLLSIVVGVRVLRRHRLRLRRDPVADPAPGGPPGGRPRPRVRRPEHARLGRELPADPHRRPDRGPRRHDGGHGHRGGPGRDRRGRSRSTCAGRSGRSNATPGRRWARTATRSSRRSAPRSPATDVVADIDPEGVDEAIPTGLGPPAVRVPPEVVEAAEAPSAEEADRPARPRPIRRREPDPDPDRDDDRDPRPAG